MKLFVIGFLIGVFAGMQRRIVIESGIPEDEDRNRNDSVGYENEHHVVHIHDLVSKIVEEAFNILCLNRSNQVKGISERDHHGCIELNSFDTEYRKEGFEELRSFISRFI